MPMVASANGRGRDAEYHCARGGLSYSERHRRLNCFCCGALGGGRAREEQDDGYHEFTTASYKAAVLLFPSAHFRLRGCVHYPYGMAPLIPCPIMASNKTTSAKMASLASRVLSDPNSSAIAWRLAAMALA